MRKVVLYALYAVVVAGLLVSIILAFHQKANAPKPKTPSTAQQKQPKPERQQKQQATSKPENNRTAQGTTPGSASQQSKPSYNAPSPAPSTSSLGKGQQPAAPATGPDGQPLTNTGPGEVIALFAGSALAGTVAYSLHQRRKLA